MGLFSQWQEKIVKKCSFIDLRLIDSQNICEAANSYAVQSGMRLFFKHIMLVLFKPLFNVTLNVG